MVTLPKRLNGRAQTAPVFLFQRARRFELALQTVDFPQEILLAALLVLFDAALQLKQAAIQCSCRLSASTRGTTTALSAFTSSRTGTRD
jgi:hypothetical protein